MRLTFAGVGSAFCGPDQWQTNAVLTKDDGDRRCLLIDCGSDARFSLKECGVGLADVGGVYVTHLHADHVGGLEWLAFSTYFNPQLRKVGRPQLFCSTALMRRLWINTLCGGLDSIEGKVMNLTDYFECQPVYPNKSFMWGDAKLSPVQTVHIMAGYQIVHSYGLMMVVGKSEADQEIFGFDHPPGVPCVRDTRRKIFFTSDTQFCPHQICYFYNQVDMIFHDCETSQYPSGVHAHYDDLKTLSPEIKAKMWLMHYQMTMPIEGLQAMAKADGFAGFVVKGQTFDLGVPR